MTAPTVGMPVKLKKGMQRLSARKIQRVTDVHKLNANEKSPDGFVLTEDDIRGEGGYWIKTDFTKGEWWAWSLFRVV